jgi:DNA-binding transcriptional ArsR family regulator
LPPPLFVANPVACQRVLGVLSLLAGETRLKILCLLRDGDQCVTRLADSVGGKRSNVSQQLKLLTLAGHLERRREERRIVYRLKDGRIRTLLGQLHEQFGAD